MAIKYYRHWDRLVLFKAEAYKKGCPPIIDGSQEEKKLAQIAGVNLEEVKREQADFIKGVKL